LAVPTFERVNQRTTSATEADATVIASAVQIQ
jgi:hypothetical protein